MNSDELVEALAALTERQREAIIAARLVGSLMLVDYTDPWTVPVAEFYTLRTDRLNGLGLRIRAHLTQNPAQGARE